VVIYECLSLFSRVSSGILPDSSPKRTDRKEDAGSPKRDLTTYPSVCILMGQHCTTLAGSAMLPAR
jgi:hypothetical protein